MTTPTQHLRIEFADLEVHEALKQPVSALLGVDSDAVDALKTIGVNNVLDLGASQVFAQADSAVGTASSVLGRLPTDLLIAEFIDSAPAGIRNLPLESLRALPPGSAEALKTALDVEALGDFVLWPPRQAAQQMLSEAIGGTANGEVDLLAERLRPALGDFPTERVYYEKLLMFGTVGDEELTPLAGTISLQDPNAASSFSQPAVGAAVTLSQSWFAQGLTLGHMVHSLALAPGEATRIALIDWSRRTAATATESIAESERLDSAEGHSRAISEVQNAVADEMQFGGSMSKGWAKSSSKGTNASASIGGGIAGIGEGVAGVFGFGGGASTTKQSAETSFGTNSASWSIGSRSVAATLTQNVNDRTEQHSSAVRNRRASSVREVSQNEHEEISTRIVANYNHMHALTVQYYEVVQLYRVVTRMHHVDRALFVPFEIIDFDAANAFDLVARYRGQLLAAALTPRVRDLLVDPDGRVEIRSAVRVSVPLGIHAEVLGAAGGIAISTSAASTTGDGSGSGGTAQPQPQPQPSPVAPTAIVARRGPVADAVPGDAVLSRISFEGVGIARVRLEQASVAAAAEILEMPAGSDQVAVAALRLSSISSLQAATDDGAEDTGTMTLHYEVGGRPSSVAVPVVLGSGTRMQTVAFLDGDPADRRGELIAHLQANRAYYTRGVLGGLDAASLLMLLSPFEWLGSALADRVDPTPIAVAGNYLVLRAPAEPDDASGLGSSEDRWADLLTGRGIDLAAQDVRLIPIPTGGVFAEAVLGRSNAAEKLDITRFWNWQDSPIPLQPTEIAPVTAGSRGQPENLTPGALGPPVLNILNPTGLPDPAGLSALIGAIASGSMFRDMSGLAGTQAAGQALSQGTLTAATEAGQLASANFKTATEQATEMAKTAADLWKVWATSKNNGNGGSDGGGSASEQGALINHGRSMDERGLTRPETMPTNGSGTSASDGGSTADGTDRMPMSNEMVRSDAAAGLAPTQLQEVRRGLGGSSRLEDLVERELGVNAEPATGSLLDPVEKQWIDQIRRDAAAAGIQLGGARLLPLRLHKNAVEFGAFHYSAWTDSDRDVYLNINQFEAEAQVAKMNDTWAQILDLMPTMSAAEEVQLARKMARVLAIIVAKHESLHLTQFRGIGRHVQFGQMVNFEQSAYFEVGAWVHASFDRALHFLNLPAPLHSGAKDLYFADTIAAFLAFKLVAAEITDWQNERAIRDVLRNRNKLPDIVQHTQDYTIEQLYMP